MKSFVSILSFAAVLALAPSGQAQAKAEVAPVGGGGGGGFGGSIASTQEAYRSMARAASTVSAASSRFGGGGSYGSSRDSTPPVIIEFSENTATNVPALEEDLTVMTRLVDKALDRALGDESPAVKAGIPMVVTSGGRSVRSMYIDGFGALFMVKVNFPLLGAPAREEKASEPPPATEWNEAKSELFGTGTRRATAEYAPSEHYNQAQVDAVKKELVSVLKQAANIRNLKSDEAVCINVFGHPAVSATSAKTKEATIYGSRGNRFGADQPGSEPAPLEKMSSKIEYLLTQTGAKSSGSAGTVLTVRAKKSDIDAFAAGKIDFDAFKEKTTITAYLGSGYGVTSVNSWVQGVR